MEKKGKVAHDEMYRVFNMVSYGSGSFRNQPSEA